MSHVKEFSNLYTWFFIRYSILASSAKMALKPMSAGLMNFEREKCKYLHTIELCCFLPNIFLAGTFFALIIKNVTINAKGI